MAVGITMLMLAVAIVFGAVASPVAGVAVGSNETIHLDDPANDTVEVDLNWSSSADATVALEDSDGTTIESQTVSGVAGDTQTVALSADYVSSGDYVLAVSSTDSANVSVDDSRIVSSRAVEVVDAGNETVVVDLVFQGSENATSTISITNDTSTEIVSDTVTYDATTDQTTYTREYNDTDGIESGNLSATISTSPETAYQSAYATVTDSSTDESIIGGALDGYDSTTILVGALAVLALLAIAYDGRQ